MMTAHQGRSTGQTKLSRIPVTTAVDRAAARRALSLPEEGRHILLMSGSIGCGPMTELARQLDEQLRSGDYATVLCGSNRQMLYALQRRSLLRVQAVGPLVTCPCTPPASTPQRPQQRPSACAGAWPQGEVSAIWWLRKRDVCRSYLPVVCL